MIKIKKKPEEPKPPDSIRLKRPHTINSLFLDSGAHGMYESLAKGKNWRDKYEFYKTKEFWDYVDAYCNFIKENLQYLDVYVNVDAIYEPEISWDVQQYMEDKHGLKPLPVIHHGTNLKWIHHYIDRGYDFIGLGGLTQEVTSVRFRPWADSVFNIICDNKDRIPSIRVHGFAVTAQPLIIRYPWWSVDSTTWKKMAGYGQICFPLKRNGKFDLLEKPIWLFVSTESLGLKQYRARHAVSFRDIKKKHVLEWLEFIDVPFGSKSEWGVINSNLARGIANLRYYQHLIEALPEWPWPFKIQPRRNLGIAL